MNGTLAGAFFSLEAFGYAFLSSWSLILFSSPPLFMDESVLGVYMTHIHDLSLVSMIITFFAASLLHLLKIPLLKNKRLLSILSLSFIEIGTALVVFIPFLVDFLEIAIVAGSILTGIGSAMLVLLWGEVYTKLPPANVLLSAAAALLFYRLLLHVASTLSYYPLCAMLLALPLLSFALHRETADLDAEDTKPDGSERLFSLLPIAFYVLLVSFVTGSLGYLPRYFETWNSLETSFVAAISIAILITAWIRFGRKANAEVFLSLGSLIAAFFLVLLPFIVYAGQQSDAFFLVSFSRLLLRVSIWSYLAIACAANNLSPILCFGTGMGVSYLGTLLGEFFTRIMMSGSYAESSEQLFVYSPILMFLLILSFFVSGKALGRKHPDISVREPEDFEAKIGRFEAKIGGIADYHTLTKREKDILRCLAKGYPSKAIQDELNISASTVSLHSVNIYRKLDIHSKSALVKIVYEWDSEKTTALKGPGIPAP